MAYLPTLADAVATHARLCPQKVATRDSQRSLTYAQWYARATGLAAALAGLGLAKGDRVAVLAYNCIEWMEIYVAMARAGLVVVPLNFRLSAPEIQYIVQDAEVRAVLAGAEFLALVDTLRSSLPIPSTNFIALGQPDAGTWPSTWRDYEVLIASADSAREFEAGGPDDMCAPM